jgi:hypothetical protein
MALQGQIEVKQSLTGKIYRLGYNEIQALAAEMDAATRLAREAGEVVLTDFNTITKESDVFTVEEGVYYNNVGERMPHSKYTSYHLLADKDFDFFFEGVMELLNQSEISTGSLYATVFSNGVTEASDARVTENFSTEGHTTEFPWKMGMSITVKRGELLVISLPDDFYYYNGNEFVKGFSCRTTYGTAGVVMADGVQFGKSQVSEVKRIVRETIADGVVLRSSTAGSTKKFKLTVDDNGTISARELADLNITTTCWSNSGYSSVSLYINGEKQYTTPQVGSSGESIVYSNTFKDVSEAYIVFEGNMSGDALTEVNGVKVWSGTPVVGAKYDLLALNTGTISIRTDFNY